MAREMNSWFPEGSATGHGAVQGGDTGPAETRIAALHAALIELHQAVGVPSLDRLVAAAAREGRTISRATLHNVLHGTTRPRLETVESFVTACLAYARNRRPRIDLPEEQTDLGRWRRMFLDGISPSRPTQPMVDPERELAIAVAAHFAAQMEHTGLPYYLPAGLTPGAIDQARKVSPLWPNPQENPPYHRPWEKVAGCNARIVLLADAGMGKSWLLGMHTRGLAGRALSELRQDTGYGDLTLPLAFRCDELAARPEPNIASAVAAHLDDIGVAQDRGRARDTLAGWMTGGRVVLLLDAYDELAGTAARAKLRTLLNTAPAALRIIVSARQAGYAGPPGAGPGHWQEFLLEPFGEGEIEAVIRLWPLRPGARDALEKRITSPQLSGLARVPLLLVLLCALAGEGSPHGDPALLPPSRGALYERMLRRFLIHEHRPPAAEDTDVDRLLGLLAPIAFHFATLPEGWQEVMRRDAVLDALRESGALFVPRQDAASLLRMLSVDAGVLQPMGNPSAGRDAPYLFAHGSFGEYLTARHISGLPEDEAVAVLDAHLAEPGRWEDVLAILGRLTWLRSGQGRFERLLAHLLECQTKTRNRSLVCAVRMLGDLGDPDLVLSTQLLEALVREFRLLVRDDLATAVQAVASCASLPAPLVDALSEVLAENLRSNVPKVVALAHHTQQSITDLLIKAATGDYYDGDRFLSGDFEEGRAVTALTHRPGADVLDALLRAFHNVHWPTYAPEQGIPHEAAVTALRTRRDPAALAPMIVAAAQAQQQMDEHDGAGFRLRRGALQVLGGYPEEAATDVLLTGAADPNPNIRETAVLGLAGRDSPAVRAAVTAALQEKGHEGEYIREAARKVAAFNRMTAIRDGSDRAVKP